MKILLIQPVPPRQYWPVGMFRSQWVPSGIASIARTLLRDGHDVRLHVREQHLVQRQMDWPAADEALAAELKSFHPDAVGLSVVTPALVEAGAIAQLAKNLCGASTLVVAGGPHPTAMPEETLAECPAIDAVSVGEGERAWAQIARGGLGPDVAGLVLRRDAGPPLHTPPSPPVHDLDSLGLPAYELLDMSYYTSPGPWMIRWLPLRATNIRTSRGCTNRCRFCAGHLVNGVGVRTHSIEHVIEQMRLVRDTYGVEAIHFEDDTLGADPDRLSRLCAAIRRAGLDTLQWDTALRVDQARPDLLKEMKASGCIQVEYGFESGSDATLARLGKHASVDANRRAVEATRAAGLRVYADIMVALPGETAQDFHATMDFIRWARPEVLSAAVLCPLPGTPLYHGLPDEARRSIQWGEYAYMGELGLRLNLTAMSERKLRALHRRFVRYIDRPWMWWSLLRDGSFGDQAQRHRVRQRLFRHFLKHPIESLRLFF